MPLDSAGTAAFSPRKDFVENSRVHSTHWLVRAQVPKKEDAFEMPKFDAPAPTMDIPKFRSSPV